MGWLAASGLVRFAQNGKGAGKAAWERERERPFKAPHGYGHADNEQGDVSVCPHERRREEPGGHGGRDVFLELLLLLGFDGHV